MQVLEHYVTTCLFLSKVYNAQPNFLQPEAMCLNIKMNAVGMGNCFDYLMNVFLH